MFAGQKFRFEVAVIGDDKVGKTSLMRKFTKGSFSKDYVKTLGVQASVYERQIESDHIRLMFRNIAGGDTFRFIRSNFLRGPIRAAIIVCSLEDDEIGRESFKHIPDWSKDVLNYAGDIPMYLFANKVDLVDENALDDGRMDALVNKYNFRGYYYTSVEAEENVMKAFDDIIMDLYSKYKGRQESGVGQRGKKKGRR